MDGVSDADRAGTRALFESIMYGPRPIPPVSTTVAVRFSDRHAFDGRGTLTELEVRTTAPDTTFGLLVAHPNATGAAVPCFLGVNFRGNHTVLADERIGAHDGWVYDDRPTARGGDAESWDVAGSVAAGFAVATLFAGDVVPDRADLAEPVLAGFATGGRRPGALMAWAWALSVALDVLRGVPEVDPRRVVAVGHSRMGKAALLAGGWDERFAAVVASQTGSAGAAPDRTAPERAVPGPDGRPEAETIAVITSSFPHWFAPTLATYADHVDDLPFEQDDLLRLTLPRPLLLWNGTDDRWADPVGTFDLVRSVTGRPDLPFPEVGQITPGPLPYGLRAGPHRVTFDDWARWRAWTTEQRAVMG